MRRLGRRRGPSLGGQPLRPLRDGPARGRRRVRARAAAPAPRPCVVARVGRARARRGARGGRRLRRGGHRRPDGLCAAGAGTGRRRRLAPCSVRAGAAEALRGAPAPRRVGRRVPRGHLRARRAPRRAARRGPVRGSGARVLRRRRAAEPVAVGLPVLDDALHLRAGPRARRRAGLGVRARGGHDELPLGARSAAVTGGV